MEEDEMLLEILKQLQKKYNCVNEIHNTTKEIGDALSRDDRISVQMLLGMRQEEMDKADECNHAVRMLESSLPVAEAHYYREHEKVKEMKNKIQSVLDRCVALDKIMSKRVGGKDSFYSS
ncbi:MAG: hypothetical protein RSA90_04515 [Lachnospiraceae bacterium]